MNRGWWEEDPGTTQRFYNQILGLPGTAPAHCEPYVISSIIGLHLLSKSMWAIFPLQVTTSLISFNQEKDLFGLKLDYIQGRDPKQDRINIPSIPEHYWRYRIHLPLEELNKDRNFTGQICQVLVSTGRGV